MSFIMSEYSPVCEVVSRKKYVLVWNSIVFPTIYI